MVEARLDDSGSSLAPDSDGWFVVNVRDAMWFTLDRRGWECSFESPKFEFPQLAIRLHVVEPGEPSGLYHAESAQEAFLVLSESACCSSKVRSGSSDSGTSSTVPPGPSTSSWAQVRARA